MTRRRPSAHSKHRQAYEERSGVKLTYLPLHPQGHGRRAQGLPGPQLERRRRQHRLQDSDVNIGIAVALDWGLIVPRHPQRGREEHRWAWPARSTTWPTARAPSKLKVDEVQGGTFTVTNPGVFGSLFGTPIINQPQVAILGVGTIEKRAVVRDDAIAIRTMAYFALSFDHRIVDGADADRFMAHLKKGLQEFDEAAL